MKEKYIYKEIIINAKPDEAYDYLVRAWSDIVLPRLKYRFEKGPVDWNNPPSQVELKGLQ